jgi:hypothetical protein
LLIRGYTPKPGLFSSPVYRPTWRIWSKGRRIRLVCGETSKKPENRLVQHLNGYKASRIVKKRGICLLPSLYAHLNPLRRANAQELEPKLKEKFIDAGVPDQLVQGGH